MSSKHPDPAQIEGYVDTHFHTLHSLKKGLSEEEFLDAALDSGMAWGVDIATGLEDFDKRTALAERYPNLYLTAGCYPSYAAEAPPDNLAETLRSQVSASPKVVAVGEIGLDYHWNYGTPERQRELLTLQIGVANEAGLPIAIHCREAGEDLLRVLRQFAPVAGGILHCFAGDWEFAAGCLDLGLHLSFAGTLTYKKAEDIREVLRRTPIDRILFETDAPYLSPVPLRGKINRPQLVRYTYEAGATLLDIPVQELADRVRENGRRLFNLPES